MSKTPEHEDRVVAPEYTACRTWMHAWDFTYLDKLKGEGYLQGLRCLRCGTEKAVLIGVRTGFRTSRGYKYPEDLDPDAAPYKMPKGSGGALTAEERGQTALEFAELRYNANGNIKQKATTGEIKPVRKRR